MQRIKKVLNIFGGQGGRFLYPLVILGVTFIAFSPALHSDFVNWDDNTYVTENPVIRSFNPDHIKQIFGS